MSRRNYTKGANRGFRGPQQFAAESDALLKAAEIAERRPKGKMYSVWKNGVKLSSSTSRAACERFADTCGGEVREGA